MILPPSVHESGHKNRWDGLVPIAPLPTWLAETVSAQRNASTTESAGEPIREGERNSRLTSLAGAMRRRGATVEAIEARRVSQQEADPYAERIQAALRQINQPDYPANVVTWLGDTHPDLYDELTSRLPDEIHLCAVVYRVGPTARSAGGQRNAYSRGDQAEEKHK